MEDIDHHEYSSKRRSSEKKNDEVHVVMFPFFAFGHVTPFLQLSNKLSSHGFRISFFTIPGFASRLQTLLLPSPNTQLIPLDISSPAFALGLPEDLAGTGDLPESEAGKLVMAIDHTRHQVETLLSELKPDLVLFDFAQHWLPSIASGLGIKTLFFSVFSAAAIGYLIALGTQIGVETLTLDNLINPPRGFPLSRDQQLGDENLGLIIKPFEAQTLLSAYKSYEDGTPSNSLRFQDGIAGCSAVVAKSCHEMEGPYLDFMKSYLNKPLLLTGPLVPEPLPEAATLDGDDKFAAWLARFSPNSVVFCSFGSETFLTRHKIRELALGLELAGPPFLLVLNFPKNVDAGAELEAALPLGFRERTKDKGLVHVGWVPQRLILGHVNVGCYLCHAGLSSLVEALVSDCQLVLLPQKLDQSFNSRVLGEKGYMKTGVEVNTRDEDGHFGKEDICAAVRTIMVDIDEEPGKSIRLNQQKWHGFLRQKEVQEKFISDLVVEMKRIVLDV